MLYRIITEDKNQCKVLDLVKWYLCGATIYHAKGLWKRQWENSLIIEMANVENAIVAQLVQEIKELNQQDVVMVQEIACDSYLI